MFDCLLYLQHDRSSARTSTTWTGVLIFFIFFRNEQFIVKLFSSMSCPYKMTCPFRNPYKMGCCSYFLASHQKVMWFYSLPSGFFGAFRDDTKWVSWNWSQVGFGFFRLLRAHQGPFFVYKFGPDKNSLWKQSWLNNQNQNPVSTSFRYSFCNEGTYPFCRLRRGIL